MMREGTRNSQIYSVWPKLWICNGHVLGRLPDWKVGHHSKFSYPLRQVGIIQALRIVQLID